MNKLGEKMQFFDLEGKSLKERLIIAHKIFEKKVVPDLLKGRIPTYHVLHFETYSDGCTADNHYMTPLSMESINGKGDRMIWVQDFEFFLKVFATDERVKMVGYDEDSPAVIFSLYSNLDIGEILDGEPVFIPEDDDLKENLEVLGGEEDV